MLRKTPVLTPCLTPVLCLYCYTTSCIYAYSSYWCAYICCRNILMCICVVCVHTQEENLDLITRERYLVFALMYCICSTTNMFSLCLVFVSFVADLLISHLYPPSFVYLFLSVHLVCPSLNLFLSSRFRFPRPSPLQDPLWSQPPLSQLLLGHPNR